MENALECKKYHRTRDTKIDNGNFFHLWNDRSDFACIVFCLVIYVLCGVHVDATGKSANVKDISCRLRSISKGCYWNTRLGIPTSPRKCRWSRDQFKSYTEKHCCEINSIPPPPNTRFRMKYAFWGNVLIYSYEKSDNWRKVTGSSARVGGGGHSEAVEAVVSFWFPSLRINRGNCKHESSLTQNSTCSG